MNIMFKIRKQVWIKSIKMMWEWYLRHHQREINYLLLSFSNSKKVKKRVRLKNGTKQSWIIF